MTTPIAIVGAGNPSLSKPLLTALATCGAATVYILKPQPLPEWPPDGYVGMTYTPDRPSRFTGPCFFPKHGPSKATKRARKAQRLARRITRNNRK